MSSFYLLICLVVLIYILVEGILGWTRTDPETATKRCVTIVVLCFVVAAFLVLAVIAQRHGLALW